MDTVLVSTFPSEGASSENMPLDALFTALTATLTANQQTNLASLLAVPQADPHVVGVIWNDAGTLKASAGP